LKTLNHPNHNQSISTPKENILGKHVFSSKDHSEKLGVSMIWLALLITSFFYVLPLGRYSLAGYSSDFRIYDFIFILYFLFTGRYQINRLLFLIHDRSQYHRYAIILIIMVIFSLGLTWVSVGTNHMPPVLIRTYRFTMYFLIGSFAFLTINTPKKQRFVLGIFYANVIIQTLLAFAQGMKWLPNLWPAYWLDNYGDFPVGTLSPHHLQIGVVMLIGIALSMVIFRLYKNIFLRGLLVLLISMMVVVILRAEIRTVWFALAGWIIAYFFIYRKQAIFPFFLLLSGLLLIYLLFGQAIWVSLQEVLNRRLIDPVEYSGLYGILGDRESIYAGNPFNLLLARPWIILVGTGFQNVSYVLGGATGAHNNYLQSFFELGIFGFIFYISFLWSIIKMLLKTIQLSKNRLEKYLSKDTLALFIAILITMFAGETMWAQYSQFTLTGQIMIVVALAVSPLNWLAQKKMPEE
jgi:hypothetical protein